VYGQNATDKNNPGQNATGQNAKRGVIFGPPGRLPLLLLLLLLLIELHKRRMDNEHFGFRCFALN